MRHVEPIDTDAASGNVCLDLPVSAETIYQIIHKLTWLLACHNRMDHEALMRLCRQTDIDSLFRLSIGVDAAGTSLTLHCRVLPRVE